MVSKPLWEYKHKSQSQHEPVSRDRCVGTSYPFLSSCRQQARQEGGKEEVKFSQ